jgi:outer membrane protein
VRKLVLVCAVFSATCFYLGFAATVVASEANNSEGCSAANEGCIAVGKWEFSVAVGAGVRSNPVVGRDPIPIVLIPSLTYYGKRFFFETDTLGFTLFETNNSMLNVVGTLAYDHIYFKDRSIGNFSLEDGGAQGESFSPNSPVVRVSGDSSGNEGTPSPSATPAPTPAFRFTLSSDGQDVVVDGPAPEPEVVTPGSQIIRFDDLPKRGLAGLVGFEYSHAFCDIDLGLQVLADATSVHQGSQMRGSLARTLRYQNHRFIFSGGFEWKDSKTLDYYYGVRPDEVDNAQDAYVPNAGTSYYLKADWRYRISKRWDLVGVVHKRWLGAEISNSPLLDDDAVTAAFIGGEYHF